MENVDRQLNNLIQLRTNLITLVIVLTVGLFSLFFVEHIPWLAWFFIVGGIRLYWVFIMNMIDAHNKIEKLLEEK
jgi:uncharacterized membrane protein